MVSELASKSCAGFVNSCAHRSSIERVLQFACQPQFTARPLLTLVLGVFFTTPFLLMMLWLKHVPGKVYSLNYKLHDSHACVAVSADQLWSVDIIFSFFLCFYVFVRDGIRGSIPSRWKASLSARSHVRALSFARKPILSTFDADSKFKTYWLRINESTVEQDSHQSRA